MITNFKIFEKVELDNDISLGCAMIDIGDEDDSHWDLQDVFKALKFFKEKNVEYRLFLNIEDKILNIIFSRDDMSKIRSNDVFTHITFFRNLKNTIEIQEENLEPILKANKYNL